MKERVTTKDSQYIQQHLANERTYLAWIRTSITIIGVGFLITNLHFATMENSPEIGTVLARLIGLVSIAIGLLIIGTSTISYFNKGRAINNQTFKYPRAIIILLSVSLILIFLAFGSYYLVVWGII